MFMWLFQGVTFGAKILEFHPTLLRCHPLKQSLIEDSLYFLEYLYLWQNPTWRVSELYTRCHPLRQCLIEYNPSCVWPVPFEIIKCVLWRSHLNIFIRLTPFGRRCLKELRWLLNIVPFGEVFWMHLLSLNFE